MCRGTVNSFPVRSLYQTSCRLPFRFNLQPFFLSIFSSSCVFIPISFPCINNNTCKHVCQEKIRANTYKKEPEGFNLSGSSCFQDTFFQILVELPEKWGRAAGRYGLLQELTDKIHYHCPLINQIPRQQSHLQE